MSTLTKLRDAIIRAWKATKEDQTDHPDRI